MAARQLAAVLLLGLAALHGAQAQLSITGFSPSSGTAGGGTRLTITGAFPNLMDNNNLVYVGPYPCTVVSHLSSESVLTCLTTPGLFGSYRITVVSGSTDPTVPGVSQASSNSFYTYASWQTPTVSGITPTAAAPGTQVQIVGNPTSQVQSACSAQNNGPDPAVSDCLSGILFQDYRCRMNLEDIQSTIAFANSYRWDGNTDFIINCTLPDPSDNILDQATFPGLAVARKVNVTVAFEASMRGGAPRPSPSAFLADVQGWPYMFQIVPVVESITPSMGSLAGGTLLTITGRGFPALDQNLGDSLTIMAGGAPCTVRTSNYSTLTCMTSPRPADYVAPAAIAGLYPGSRGLEMEWYNTTTLANAPSFQSLWVLNSSAAWTSAALNGSKAVRLDVFEAPMELIAPGVPNWCSLGKAFFTAPTTGDYTFLVTADDYIQLNGTWVHANGTTLTNVRLAFASNWVEMDNFAKFASQKSAPVTLQAGQSILLTAASCNGPSVGSAQVGVIMPSAVGRWASQGERQRISISGPGLKRTTVLRYMWPTGNDTVFNATVTFTDASLLNHPQIGLNLTLFNNQVISFNVSTPPDAVRSLFLGALRGSNISALNTSVVGVMRSNSSNSITYTFAVSTSVVPDVSAAAILVLQPAPAAPAPAPAAPGCTFKVPAPPGDSFVPFTPPAGPATIDATALAAGASVAITNWTLAGVASPASQWMLVSSAMGSATPSPIPWNANSSAVLAAARAAWAADVVESVSDVVYGRFGPFLTYTWVVTNRWEAGNNLAPLTMVPGPAGPLPTGVIVSTNITQITSAPANGTVRLALGQWCDEVSLELSTDNVDSINTKLGALPLLNGARLRDVARGGNDRDGYTITLTWDPLATPGDQPQLRVTRTNAVYPVSISTLQNGTTDFLYPSITGEFLSLAVAEPNTAKISINGVPATCRAANPSGCAFVHDGTMTPNVTAVSPTGLDFGTGDPLTLTITGTGFSATAGDNVVTVGGARCNVTAASPTSLTCSIAAAGTPSGVRQLAVRVGNIGFASGAPSMTVKTLAVTAVAPTTLNAATANVLNITGRGFIDTDCGSNIVTLGDVVAGVVSCNATNLQVVVPANATLTGTVTLTMQVLNGTAGNVLDSASFGSALTIAASAPGLLSWVSPDPAANQVLPGSGGNITVTLSDAASASAVSALWLIPAIPTVIASPAAAFLNISSSFAKRVACSSLAASAANLQATCPPLPNGYWVVMARTNSGAHIILPGPAVQVGLFISSVSPAQGSIGGNTTLTITGSGFNSLAPNGNVVLLPVPTSTTFLNGVILCDILTATPTQITCLTRPHLAANAAADDPLAFNTMPVPSPPDQVILVACNSSLTQDILKVQCYSQGASAARAASTNFAATVFSYATAVTPAISWVSPAQLEAGATFTIGGAVLGDVTEVQLRQGRFIRAVCATVNATDATVNCTLPADLPAGAYTVVLRKSNGELSVDANKQGRIVVAPYITSALSNVGSIAGGGQLTLMANGTGWNDTSLNANQVVVGGAPCAPVSANRTHLTCTTTGIQGLIRAEYWNLPPNTNSMPDVLNFVNPLVSRLESGLAFNWGSSSPAPGTINNDYFVARFTFFLQAPTSDNYTFAMTSDDSAMLFVNDLFRGSSSTSSPGNFNFFLPAGHHKFVITYMEVAGSANLRLVWAPVPNSAANTTIPWFRFFTAPPSSPTDIRATINGIPALQGCATQSFTWSNTSAVLAVPEPTTTSSTGPQCAYVYTSYQTPTLTVPLVAQPAVTTNASLAMPTTLNLTGLLLGGTDPAAYAVSIVTRGGEFPCPVTSVANNTDNTTQTLACTLPQLPGGNYAVRLNTVGLGFARPDISNPTPRLNYTFSMGVTLVAANMNASLSSATRSSFFGGSIFRVQGWGLSTLAGMAGRKLTVTSATNSRIGNTAVTVVSANMTTVILRTARWVLGNRALPPPTSGSGSVVVFNSTNVASTGVSVSFSLTETDPSAAGALDSTFTLVTNGDVGDVGSSTTFTYNTDRTPWVAQVSPLSLTPTTGGSLTLSWAMGRNAFTSTLAQDGFSPSLNGATSQATVELVSGANSYACTTPTLTRDGTIGASGKTYNESLTCTLPTYLPAGDYTVWVCVLPMGCGYATTGVNVTLAATAVTPASGSAGGGRLLTITGSGFGANTTEVSVWLGNITCPVVAVTNTQLQCRTLPLPSIPTTTTTTLPIIIQPSAGAINITTSLTHVYDLTLTPRVLSISPNRGGSEGGTTITIIGTDFPTGVDPATLNFKVGPYNCTSPTIINATTATCVTTSPPAPKPKGPQAVTLSFDAFGTAFGANVTYTYVDLWSRRTTWGGNNPPVEGDSVFIPEGATVLLDISTPILGAVVVEGNLEFDPSATSEILLQANWILVKGGNLTIGRPGAPYPGKARITLYGPPYSRELPLYGAKTIAVRYGNVVMNGKPKTPSWTVLTQDADVGATSLSVLGPVNWVAGDYIAVASSSIYANETSEALLTAVSYNAATNVTTLTLDRALNYTHLGSIVPAGDVYNRVFDMRAEVAVLNRDIVIEGDKETSERWLYGGQIQVHTPPSFPTRAQLQLEQVELRRMGQAFRLGRYAIHWHMHGNVNFNSWMKGVTVHHTYNRAATIHGTHNVLTQDCVAYDNMGHAFFLEDGNETGNIYERNLGFLTRRSDAMLNTDTTPATFWVTNPNNTYRHNRAGGSINGYGFWYRFLQNPEGPSFTTTVCPRLTPMGEFTNNTAHSNMFYGLRVHPEYLPQQNPCGSNPDDANNRNFTQIAATFNGLNAYKNGVKGAIATQVGLVKFANMTLADNGGGPLMHIVNGKDNGANYELTWIVDTRNRMNTSIDDMAGLFDSIMTTRTLAGRRGTAGRWPASSRKITGVIMHSPAEFHPKHSALGALANVTFVNYTSTNPGQFQGALDFCGKCKAFQGGATTFTRALKFIQATNAEKPMLSAWSWGHQGVYQDTDGTLINAENLPADLVTAATTAGITLGAINNTWHSAVDNDMFDPAECVYVRSHPTSNNGAFCKNTLMFRRIMLNGHNPDSLTFRPLRVHTVDGANPPAPGAYNGTSIVYFTKYNEMGYQFTVPVQRDYYLSWLIPFRVDPQTANYRKADPLFDTGNVTLTTRFVQRWNHFKLNGGRGLERNATNTTQSLLMTLQHGSYMYNTTLSADPLWYGNMTYNATRLTVQIAGNIGHNNQVAYKAFACPDSGCTNQPDIVIDTREGELRWSDPATWVSRPGGKPQFNETVTVPAGWRLLLDENPPLLWQLIIQGNLTVDRTQDITLNASYVLVQGSMGLLSAGLPENPHPRSFRLFLNGTRQTPDFALRSDVNFGAKVLGAFAGGRIELHGTPVNQRWTRLGANAFNGSQTITLASAVNWPVGGRILITSSSWNPWQAEQRTITAVSGTVLTLDTPLQWTHLSTFYPIPNRPAVDMRAEVGLLTSNVMVAAADGPSTIAFGGEFFGGRIMTFGPSILRMSHAQVTHCGHAGMNQADAMVFRPAVLFDRPAPVDNSVYALPGLPLSTIPNPSFIQDSAVSMSLNGGIYVTGTGINVTNNVVWYSYDDNTLQVIGSNNVITNNLVGGTVKLTQGKSNFDNIMPFTVSIASPNNLVTGNVAAGGDRAGWEYFGPQCTTNAAQLARFSNNSAHSNVVGAWLKAASGTTCTLVYNFTSYMNWDFGIISTAGISTDVEIRQAVFADTKYAGQLILYKGDMSASRGQVTNVDTTFIGQSAPEVCSLCRNRVNGGAMDPGCHPNLAPKSHNKNSPFTPARGIMGSTFALKFTPGPEQYPWDGLKGYALVHGVTRMTGTTFVNFYGPSGCGGTMQTHALGNHPDAPEAFHPVYMTASNLVNVSNTALTKFYGPDPAWRNEADCDTINWSRSLTRLIQNDIMEPNRIELNCAGPKHIMFRDTDGTLTGQVGAIIGQNGIARQFPYDQGTPLLPGPCQFSSTWEGYQCRSNSSNFELAAALKPVPTPVGGIFGDPQHFVLESRDPDSEDRNFSPVMFNVSGSVDLVTTAMDHGWCFAYTCQKRLSTFWTYLPSNHNVSINFTGTPARVFRVYWPYADPSAEIVITINYLYTPNRRFVFSPTLGRIPPLTRHPVIGDGTPHGSYFWEQDTTLLTIKLRGGQEPLELRTENAVMVSQSLAVTFDQFFDVREMFLSNLAFLLGIPLSRIQIVNVVPGTVNLNYLVYDVPSASEQPIPERTFDTSRNQDAGTMATVRSLPADQQAAFLAQSQAAESAAAAREAAATNTTLPPPPPPISPPPPAPPPPLNASIMPYRATVFGPEFSQIEPQLATFRTAFARAVASAANLTTSAVSITGVAPGSVVVSYSVAWPITTTAAAANAQANAFSSVNLFNFFTLAERTTFGVTSVHNMAIPLPPFPPRPPRPPPSTTPGGGATGGGGSTGGGSGGSSGGGAPLDQVLNTLGQLTSVAGVPVISTSFDGSTAAPGTPIPSDVFFNPNTTFSPNGTSNSTNGTQFRPPSIIIAPVPSSGKKDVHLAAIVVPCVVGGVLIGAILIAAAHFYQVKAKEAKARLTGKGDKVSPSGSVTDRTSPGGKTLLDRTLEKGSVAAPDSRRNSLLGQRLRISVGGNTSIAPEPTPASGGLGPSPLGGTGSSSLTPGGNSARPPSAGTRPSTPDVRTSWASAPTVKPEDLQLITHGPESGNNGNNGAAPGPDDVMSVYPMPAPDTWQNAAKGRKEQNVERMMPDLENRKWQIAGGGNVITHAGDFNQPAGGPSRPLIPGGTAAASMRLPGAPSFGDTASAMAAAHAARNNAGSATSNPTKLQGPVPE